jgi:hypothetical protein
MMSKLKPGETTIGQVCVLLGEPDGIFRDGRFMRYEMGAHGSLLSFWSLLYWLEFEFDGGGLLIRATIRHKD